MANLYMTETPYLPDGNPETMNVAAMDNSGQLGLHFQWNQGTSVASNIVEYQFVQAKTGITFAAGEVLWWDNRSTKVVTNVSNGGVVAGIVPSTAPTAAYYFCCIKKGMRNVKFLDAPTVAPDTAGKLVVASATNGRADCVTVASSLAPIGRTHGAQDGTSKLAMVAVNILDEAA